MNTYAHEKESAIDLLDWMQRSFRTGAPSEGAAFGLADGIELHYPGAAGPNHWYLHGFVPCNDFSADLRDWAFVTMDIHSPSEIQLVLTVDIGYLVDRSPQPEEVRWMFAQVYVVCRGDKRVSIPLRAFDDLAAQSGHWKFIRAVRVRGEAEDGDASAVQLQGFRFERRQGLLLTAPVRSRSADAGSAAEYELTVINCADEAQGVVLSQKKEGWEKMTANLAPDRFILGPGESRSVRLAVTVPERIAPGGYEMQTIIALGNGGADAAEEVAFTTARSLPHPYILMTEPEWEDARRRIQADSRAQALLGRYIERAEQWTVPPVHPGRYMFETHHSHEAQNAAIVWKLTGERRYAEKAALFLRRLTDPLDGYERRMKACSQELVHEGEFFKHTAAVYDLLCESDLLDADDRARIEKAFRLYMDLIDWVLRDGRISNWSLAELAGAVFCALALQDLERMNRFVFGSGGALEHLAKGTLDDGWWYECSVGYNLMAAGLLTELAQSLRPWGINLIDAWVPASYYDRVSAGDKPEIDGLALDIWGPNKRNYRSIAQLWDSLLPFADYRGIVFGINDSAETNMPGIAPRGYLDARFDLAFYLYRKPEYAELLGKCPLEDRDLLFMLPDEPSEEPYKPYLASAYADNAGVAVLRSQTEGRPPRERIQAAVKYGSHGGAHGQYDRTGLVSLMRYGRSLFNPENIWYNYHTFMYKFYVQNSITHNMVTVDLKLQDPTEGRGLLFHAGSLFQAFAAENEARWSNPPYGGWRVNGDRTFAERTWNEGRYVPIPPDAPAYSSRSDFTEPVLQRRLTVVTDDYVALFDYARGDREHAYDCLFHFKGLAAIEAPVRRDLGHTAQLTEDPLSSAQFVTDCRWYAVEGTTRTRFETGFGDGYDNRANRTAFNEDGPLHLDLYAAWPPARTLIVGTEPEYLQVEKQLGYEVRGDGGEALASGQFGAWVLGRDDLDLSVAGVNRLELRVRVAAVQGEHGFPKTTEKSVFWGDPYLVTASGEKRYLADLPLECDNVDPGHGVGVDYFGGPVKIAGERFDRAIPANPADLGREAVIAVDLSGLDAVRLVASVGGDFPLGDETARRKLVSARTEGKQARFVHVLEPFEKDVAIESVEAKDADALEVRLKDGRIQVIRVAGIEDNGNDLRVDMVEYDSAGMQIRRESARTSG
ncbi:hypothetical protein [Cohnella sp. GbtcB17]|uniref:hypothetical protein n=1 Tax=Cohnella sp. GbtcB17 TaxID=2824762 RepID=UPI001C30AC8A|nr:hypothetical protein [Cohnella sp. GbtcB17]